MKLSALRKGKMILLMLIVSLTLGAASTATGHTGSVGLFHLNHSNTVNSISTLVGSVTGPVLRLDNNNSASGTALSLQVEPNQPPMKVNSSTKVDNLNADQLDGQEPTDFLPRATYTQEKATSGFCILTGASCSGITFCDAGDVIMSGGYHLVDVTGTTIVSTGPAPAGQQGWHMIWRNNDQTWDPIIIKAYCADFGTPHTP